MFRNALRPAVLPLLIVWLAGAAQAETDPACLTAVARDFNALVPLLAEAQREGRDEAPGLVGRLNALRARITAAMEATAPAGESCDTLARDLTPERDVLQRLVPVAPPVAKAAPIVAPSPAVPVVTAEALPASPPPAAKPPVRAAERRVATVSPAPPPTPVKRAAYTTPAPVPRVDPELEACKTQVRQTHADAQLQLQMAARSGRIVPQKLPDMQRAQSRLEGLTGAVRRDFESVGECQQLGQVLVREVGNVQALAR